MVQLATHVCNPSSDDVTRFDRVLNVVCISLNRRAADSSRNRAGVANDVEEHVGSGHELVRCQDHNPSTLRPTRLEHSCELIRLLLLCKAGISNVPDDHAVPVEPVMKTNSIIRSNQIVSDHCVACPDVSNNGFMLRSCSFGTLSLNVGRQGRAIHAIFPTEVLNHSFSSGVTSATRFVKT